MYVDLLDSQNYLLVNISLIKLLGLSGAAYCSELFTIMKKAIKKDKLINCCVKVDREYVESKTGVSADEQRALEDCWQKMDLIEKVKGYDENVFDINTEGFLALISGQEDFKDAEIEKLKSKLKPKTAAKEKESKRIAIANGVKASITCPTQEVKEKMDEWVETMSINKKPLSKSIAKVFYDAVVKYSGGDTYVMEKVIQKAISNGYADVDYAIHAYETSLTHKEVNPSTEFKRATSISGGNKF